MKLAPSYFEQKGLVNSDMNTKTVKRKIGGYWQSGGWYRLVILLLILSLALAACGGGDDSDSGDEPETQSEDDYSTLPAATTDKGAIEIGESISDEIGNNDEVHSYQLVGVSGANVRIRIGAEGSAFTSPYVFLYGPDDALIDSSDFSTSSRSSSVTHALEEGTYTIVVRAIEGRGMEPYQVSVEEEE